MLLLKSGIIFPSTRVWFNIFNVSVKNPIKILGIISKAVAVKAPLTKVPVTEIAIVVTADPIAEAISIAKISSAEFTKSIV